MSVNRAINIINVLPERFMLIPYNNQLKSLYIESNEK